MKPEHVELIKEILGYAHYKSNFYWAGEEIGSEEDFEKLIAAIEAEKDAEINKAWSHNGARLRLICKMVGINTELLPTNEELDSARFSMLGEIRRRLGDVLEQNQIAGERIAELETRLSMKQDHINELDKDVARYKNKIAELGRENAALKDKQKLSERVMDEQIDTLINDVQMVYAAECDNKTYMQKRGEELAILREIVYVWIKEMEQ